MPEKSILNKKHWLDLAPRRQFVICVSKWYRKKLEFCGLNEGWLEVRKRHWQCLMYIRVTTLFLIVSFRQLGHSGFMVKTVMLARNYRLLTTYVSHTLVCIWVWLKVCYVSGCEIKLYKYKNIRWGRYNGAFLIWITEKWGDYEDEKYKV